MVKTQLNKHFLRFLIKIYYICIKFLIMTGRPLKFKSAEELEKKIEEYFKYCDGRMKKEVVKTKDYYEVIDMPFPRPYTIEGLAVFLDTNRQTLLNYSDKDAFFDVITRAKNRILANKVEGGMDRTYDPGISKFMLINNYGMSDKKEESTDDKNININIQYPPNA